MLSSSTTRPKPPSRKDKYIRIKKRKKNDIIHIIILYEGYIHWISHF